MSPNKNDSNKALVLERLSSLRAALKNEPSQPLFAQALEQCDRLELAISQFHAEGLRFAAFTLFRMLQQTGTISNQVVHTATQDLKAALDTAGYSY
jgi:hypothetical protein